MAKSKTREGRRAAAAGRSKLRARKSGAPSGPKLASGKSKPTKLTARKRPPAREPETAKLKRLLQAAKLRQQASAEILRAVANAAGDVAGPLQLIAETTARLFGATSVSIQLAEGREFTQEYRVGAIAKRIGSAYPRSSIKVGGRNLPGTVVADNRQIHIPDLDDLDPSMADFPGLPHARAGGARTVCGTPLRREGSAIGALIVFRDQLAPFTDDDLSLQQTFADQAVIAIENARLFNETREALERQTATSDILRIINQSPSDVTPVFDAIAERARVLCGALLGATTRFDGKLLHLVGYHGVSPQAEAVMRSSFPRKPDLSSINGRCILTKSPVQIADIEKDPHYQLTTAAKAADYRSLVAVPMLQGGDVIGVIAVTRKEPGEFPRKLIDLLQTFADQAVIAIENVRLFEEVQAKTRDLEGSLQQQTATAEVLHVTSNSPGELQPVFKAVLQNATRICDAQFGTLFRFDGDAFYFAADVGTPEAMAEYVRRPGPFQGPAGGMIDRIHKTRQVQHLADYAAESVPGIAARLGGARTTLGVPILRDDVLVGAIVIYRQEVRPFTDREIDLVRSFAAQAAIAIENARLFNETKETLQHQIASADVLQVVGKSMADAHPVFERIVDSLERLMAHKHIAIFLTPGDGMLHLAARRGPSADDLDPIYPAPIEKTAIPAVTKSLRQLYFPDALHGLDVPESIRRAARANGNYSDVLTPLLWEERLVGMIAVTREPNVPFGERELAVLRTFADQAVIAIENARLFRETKQALERQTATSEILRVIASSPDDVQPVFDAIASSARRLIGGFSTAVHLVIDDMVHLMAFTPTNPEADAILVAAHPRHRSEVGAVALVENGEIAQIADSETADAHTRQLGRARGWRSLTLTPLMSQGKFIGFIASTRRETGVLGNHHIELLRTFADQAVIAIENARLFDEVQAKTRDLEGSLQQQTATSDILRVISRSPTDERPVFDVIVQTAVRLFGCETAFILRCDEANFWSAAMCRPEGLVPITNPRRAPIDPSDNFPSRAIVNKATLHLPDWSQIELPEFERRVQEERGYQSAAFLPLLREQQCIGVLGLAGSRPHMFGETEVALAESFRDQALIAIENARLFNEVQARTRDLTESLQQQTATADVLKVISRSAFDLDAVMNTLARSAAELCAASLCGLHIREGDFLVCRGYAGATKEQEEFVRQARIPADDMNFLMNRVLSSCEVANIGDFENLGSLPIRTFQEKLGFNSLLMVPLMREGRGIGLFVLGRPCAGEFSSRHIELVQTFADQAVIAIENARLFDEVQAKTRDLTEALTYQTGSANILNVIASSPTDVAPVLKAIVESACEVCEAHDAAVLLRDGDDLRFSAHRGPIPIGLEKWPINRRWTAGRAFIDQQTIHLEDLRDDRHAEFSDGRELSLRMGHRTIVSVPLLRDRESIGAIVLRRVEVNPFSDKQITLLQTFADQAVIALGNVRLFEEVQAMTRDLQEALQQQTATADVLKVISRSVFDLQNVLETLIKSAVELSGANRGSIFLREGEVFPLKAASSTTPDFLQYWAANPPRAGRGSATSRVIASGKVEMIPDVLADPEVEMPSTSLKKIRGVLGVPMLRDVKVEGVLVLTRAEPGPFTQSQIDLMQTFADQAMIAIENARLFDEVQARTKELSLSLDELRAAQDRLVQTEKLASLGQLTAGIAHEIKNPLNFVNNFSALSVELTDELNDLLKGAKISEDMSKEVDELTSLLKDNLGKVVQHGRRADSIVKNMLLHSREGSGEHRPSDVNALVEESLNLAYHGARAERSQFNVTIERDLDPEAGKIEAFPQEITRVLLNLITNGFYAVGKRKAENGSSGFAPVVKAATRGLPAHVEIRIRDNGTGILPEVKEKMFNPFFTTKPAGEGTGLGLSMSHDIVVKQHGGTIDVETVPGEFTEFTIRLPRRSDFKVSNGD